MVNRCQNGAHGFELEVHPHTERFDITLIEVDDEAELRDQPCRDRIDRLVATGRFSG
jgi:hypothetical protein